MNNVCVDRKEGYTQVCVWPACVVTDADSKTRDTDISEFEELMLKEFGVHVQYLEEIKTNPDKDEYGYIVPETGNRNDLFFAILGDDVPSFAVPRLRFGIRWIEDALSNVNNTRYLYPDYVSGYCSWNPDNVNSYCC